MRFPLEFLDYQQTAVSSVVRLFEGQTRNTFDTSFQANIQSNVCDLTAAQLRANAERVMRENGLDPAKNGRLQPETAFDPKNAAPPFCVEMETGTGKTLVYLRTLYELHQQYGFAKFIILVPSIAIRGGVMSSFKQFGDQLADRYGFRLEPLEYDSKKLNRVASFVTSPDPQVLVMTIQSFSSEDAILNQTGRDDSVAGSGLTYLQALGETRPIVVMDEPQEGMDTGNAQDRLRTLRPLCTLRYSATHKPEYLRNLLYRLTPRAAYRAGLVKKIRVLTVSDKNAEATLKLRVVEVNDSQIAFPKVKLEYWKLDAEGQFKLAVSPWLNKGADVAAVSKNVSYAGYVIDRIYKGLDDRRWRVKFTQDENGREVELVLGEKSGDVAGLFRLQLEYLIRSHFAKRERLRANGIKCLSLVFIDRVANYQGDGSGETPLIRGLFADEYRKVYALTYPDAPKPTDDDVTRVQGAYFSQRSKSADPDSATAVKAMQKDAELFQKILNGKEELLRLDDPVEFIFSHSALGVGWDNPNIFNIATLNQSYSDSKKRQEIGRGLRLCLNQHGDRIRDTAATPEGEELNLLTVVPNETYEAFAAQYQEQIREAFGTEGEGAPMTKQDKDEKPKPTPVRRRSETFESEAFRAFWERLKGKTRYTVAFDEAKLVTAAINALRTVKVAVYEAEIIGGTLVMAEEPTPDNGKPAAADGGGFSLRQSDSVNTSATLTAHLPPIDVVEELSEKGKLAYRTVLDILAGLPDETLKHLARNPLRWVQEALPKLKRVAHEQLYVGITYHPTGEQYKLEEVFPVQYPKTEKQGGTLREVAPTPRKGLYDGVIVDSDTERRFALAVDGAGTDAEVVCFLKFPLGYQIPTLLGAYSPDWGIVYQRKSAPDADAAGQLYFVVETKGTNELGDTKALTDDERLKMQCATQHFAALGLEAYVRYVAPVKDYAAFKGRIDTPAGADYPRPTE